MDSRAQLRFGLVHQCEVACGVVCSSSHSHWHKRIEMAFILGQYGVHEQLAGIPYSISGDSH